jgi:superfamily II DNA or RNA helicase
MFITEPWVGQAAGGRVFKDARALLRLGKVTALSCKETDEGHVFQAQVGSGKRPMRVVVKVLSPTRVKNLCSCAVARSTGAMCEHAAAVVLAGIQKREEDAQAPKASSSKAEARAVLASEVMPLEIRISPRFPTDGLGTVHLKCFKEAEVVVADARLAQWLMENVGSAGAAMISLPEEKLAGFYQAISGHPRVFCGDSLIRVDSGRLRPALDLELEGETMWLKLRNSEEDEGNGEGLDLITLGHTLAEWDAAQSHLTVDNEAEGFKAWNSMLTGIIKPEDLLAGDWLQIELTGFVKVLDVLAEVFQLPGDLGGLTIEEGMPVIELKLAGSTRALQASLSAIYAGGERVVLASSRRSDVSFPIPSDESGKWFVRNPECEQQAISRLMESGFQVLDAAGAMLLRGEDEVIDFLTGVLPALRRKWQVLTDQKLQHVEQRVERITPCIEPQGAGNDWLACDLSWQVGGRVLDAGAVRKMLQSGSRTVATPGGGKAVISHFDAEVMKGFLLDTDPRQEDGRYYFSTQQSAYLERLRAHYGNDQKRHEELVPELPATLAQTLRGYQQEGVDWLYRCALNGGAALLADDMGLGKTLQTLAFLKLWKTNNPQASELPVLIVCPATLLGTWRDEAQKFIPDFNVLIMHGARRKDYYEVMASADLIVTSYALLDRDAAHYVKLPIAAMVLDEASAIRNPDTLAAKAARKVKQSAPDAACVAITGTPVENSVRDLWSIFQFLMPGYLGSREDFRTRYEVPCAAELPDRAALQRLRWRTEPFMLRRVKSQVAKDLPPKIESIVWCDPSPMQRDHYQAILRHGVEKMDQVRKSVGKEGARMQMLTVLLRLRQSCCDLRLIDDKISGESISDVSAKLARLLELLGEARRGGHRVLVFSQFTSMLSLIRHELDEGDVDYCYLDGGTRDRTAVVDRFQKSDGPSVFLISLKAGGYGLTLTAADTVVLFDPWWNPAVEAQAADRIHRIGQTKPATIYKFISRGTVEEKILRLQDKKRNVMAAAMGEMSDELNPMMAGLSDEEMMNLLA